MTAKRAFRAFLTAVLFSAAASAHERWADGTMVPAWVKAQCCGVEDIHHLRPDEVHRVDCGGRLCYRIDGLDGLIRYDQALPSQDGEYWIFYHNDENPESDSRELKGVVMTCFFVPIGRVSVLWK
jgi:hypothetical protein